MIILMRAYTHRGLGTPTVSTTVLTGKTSQIFLVLLTQVGFKLRSLDLMSYALPTEPPRLPPTSGAVHALQGLPPTFVDLWGLPPTFVDLLGLPPTLVDLLGLLPTFV